MSGVCKTRRRLCVGELCAFGGMLNSKDRGLSAFGEKPGFLRVFLSRRKTKASSFWAVWPGVNRKKRYYRFLEFAPSPEGFLDGLSPVRRVGGNVNDTSAAIRDGGEVFLGEVGSGVFGFWGWIDAC